jgi:ubiquinone/menaquinone biosynthesis C-methylase UbiE
MKTSDRWNRIIYRLWAPVYDAALGRFFLRGRTRALHLLALRPGERVLIVGVGTGADMPLLPGGVHAVGIDLSAPMLARARARLPLVRAHVELMQGDVQRSMGDDGSFDAAILNLILSVVPDPRACLLSALRALTPGGRAVIFDKFVPGHSVPSPGRRMVSLFSRLLGTDMSRRFSDIAAGCDCTVTHDEPSILRGTYRVMLIRRQSISERSSASKVSSSRVPRTRPGANP